MVKKLLYIVIVLILVFNLSSITQAANLRVYSSDFECRLENGIITIVGYIGNGTTAIIPSEINGYPVERIKREALSANWTKVTDVFIPASVKSIVDDPFYSDDLTSITVDGNNSAYSSKDGVLFNKEKSELILYPCGKMGSYSIPSSVTKIGKFAFRRSINLTKLTIPSSLNSIDSSSIIDCAMLTSINVDQNNKSFVSVDGVLFNYNKSELIRHPSARTGSYSIPGTVKSIWDWAFYRSGNLTAIIIPNSVTNIGQAAFYQTESLKDLDIPDSVEYIGKMAFSNCYKLASIRLPNNLKSIEEGTFTFCPNLNDINIPNSVTSIGCSAFSSCKNLKNIDIPDNVVRIDSGAFDHCVALESATISKNIKKIGVSAFGGCAKLEKVVFRGDTPSMENGVFLNCSPYLVIYYQNGNNGFSNPWYGYKTSRLTAPISASTTTSGVTATQTLPTPTTSIKGTQASSQIKSKDTTITSKVYKIDLKKSTIAIIQQHVPLAKFKSNIQIAKGAVYTILGGNGKTIIKSGNVLQGMKIKVVAQDKKTSRLYTII